MITPEAHHEFLSEHGAIIALLFENANQYDWDLTVNYDLTAARYSVKGGDVFGLASEVEDQVYYGDLAAIMLLGDVREMFRAQKRAALLTTPRLKRFTSPTHAEYRTNTTYVEQDTRPNITFSRLLGMKAFNHVSQIRVLPDTARAGDAVFQMFDDIIVTAKTSSGILPSELQIREAVERLATD